MKIRLALGALAMAALAACGAQSKPPADTAAASASSTPTAAGDATSGDATSSADTSNPATSNPASASPAVSPAKGEKPTREFLIGKWGTDGDCQIAIDLRPDGTSDGPFGNWAYSDGVISAPGEPDFKVNVTIIDNNTMKATNPTSDKPSTMTRCP